MEQEPDFEGDRVVIREAEEAKTQQKQGWFSKRTKKTSLSPSVASRPPTAASFGSSRRKGSSKSQEDDLPPRTDATPNPLPSPAGTDSSSMHISPERRPSDSVADVPVHAGFDLAAIKHMIGEAARDPEQLMVPQTKPDQAASVPPPTLPSFNPAPPLSRPIRQTETGAVNPVPYDDVDQTPTFDRSLPDTLNATFTTSVTLHGRDPYRTMDRAQEDQREAKPCSEPNAALSRPTYPPEISPEWSLPKGLGNASDALGDPFAGSTEGLSSRYLAQPPHSHDRLGTLGAQSSSATSPSLSFGSPDGSITFQGLEPDPWGTPAESRSSTGNGLGMNPWSL